MEDSVVSRKIIRLRRRPIKLEPETEQGFQVEQNEDFQQTEVTLKEEPVQTPVRLKLRKRAVDTSPLQSSNGPTQQAPTRLKLKKRFVDTPELQSLDGTIQQAPARLKIKLKKNFLDTPDLPSLDDIIKKNKKPMEECSAQKKRAQDIYYSKIGNSGVSPMTRVNTPKAPVKHRLGKIPYTGTSTSTVPPKRRLNKNITLNNTIRARNRQINYAQKRLDAIRENHRMLASVANDSTVNIKRKSIRLTRRIPNFQVQIKNTHLLAPRIKRFKLELNADIQFQLQELKKAYTGEIINIEGMSPETTNISFDSRFSNLN